LSPSEMKFLQSQGSILIPLIDQQSSSFAATQGLPGPEVLHQDILAYASRQWSAGINKISGPPFVSMNGSFVSQKAQTAINDLSLTLQGNVHQIVTDWTAIPNPIKIKWASIIAVGMN
jgi:hypothetical protein